MSRKKWGLLLCGLGLGTFAMEQVVYRFFIPIQVNGMGFQDFLLSGRPYHLVMWVLLLTGLYLLFTSHRFKKPSISILYARLRNK